MKGFYPLTILAKSSIIDFLMGSKYASQTFIKFAVIKIVLYVIFGFHMPSRLFPIWLNIFVKYLSFVLYTLFFSEGNVLELLKSSVS